MVSFGRNEFAAENPAMDEEDIRQTLIYVTAA
jgi:hypothetical protein